MRPEARTPPEWRRHRAPETMAAAELMGMEFDPTQWVVRDVLPEGLSLLAGKPKKGKSWMALGMCEAVAADGFLILRRTPGSKGPTLYVDGRYIEEPTEMASLLERGRVYILRHYHSSKCPDETPGWGCADGCFDTPSFSAAVAD